MIRIDKVKVYESHGYKFRNFVTLSLEEKLMVLEWRNHEKVRNMMVNKEKIGIDDHLTFIDKLYEREDCFYWLVEDPLGIDIGVLDLIHVDYDKDEGEIGFYINPVEVGKGFEFMIECDFFVFNELKLGNNIVTVNVKNKDILLFDKYIGLTFEYKEKIGNEEFLINKHAKGDYIITHYEEFSLLNYAKFVKNNKKNITINM